MKKAVERLKWVISKTQKHLTPVAGLVLFMPHPNVMVDRCAPEYCQINFTTEFAVVPQVILEENARNGLNTFPL